MKKIKVRKRSNVKERAWFWFSKYIRLRDCILTTKTKDECICVTCGDRLDFKHIQAGHCIAGRNDTILYDEDLVHGQCEHCNTSPEYGGLGGNYAVYHLWFIDNYGRDEFEKKVFLSNQEGKLSTPELQEISDKYRIMYKELLKS